MSPNDKLLAAIFGHTTESATTVAAEKATRLSADWVRAGEMAAVANADNWASSLGEWVPVLYWGNPAALCGTRKVEWQNNPSGLGVYGVSEVDMDEITYPT